MKDVTADGMFNAAVEKGPISTMPDIPGIAVWHQGHIGVYIGNGYVIHAANTYDGVIKTPITSSGIPNIRSAITWAWAAWSRPTNRC